MGTVNLKNKVVIIAKNTFLELVRDRVIYGILVFAFLLVLMSLVVAQLSYVESQRILMDLGLAGLEVSALILSVFLGATIVFREVEKRTVLTLFARPVSRGQFLLGKFFGLYAIVCVAVSILTIIFLGLLLASTFRVIPIAFLERISRPLMWFSALVRMYSLASAIAASGIETFAFTVG